MGRCGLIIAKPTERTADLHKVKGSLSQKANVNGKMTAETCFVSHQSRNYLWFLSSPRYEYPPLGLSRHSKHVISEDADLTRMIDLDALISERAQNVLDDRPQQILDSLTIDHIFSKKGCVI